ncbi:DNA damage-responsive transcriptional repressor RPH1 [Ceratobasidium sp. AG-Ba]|nr:DNA damage-responsive transcriptional repressor RPH1 [Ceratobasidium sp. AG-Ba]QRW11081.1 DNA damage-responsive transcriptional repressor RPH1 [Ceratobasidium sp. AG-Ba]
MLGGAEERERGEDTAEDEEKRDILAGSVHEAKPRADNAETPIPKDDDEFHDSLESMDDWLPPGTSAADSAPGTRKGSNVLGQHAGQSFRPRYEDVEYIVSPQRAHPIAPDGNQNSGVTTPFLHLNGTWRATRKWHVEELDIRLINVIGVLRNTGHVK